MTSNENKARVRVVNRLQFSYITGLGYTRTFYRIALPDNKGTAYISKRLVDIFGWDKVLKEKQHSITGDSEAFLEYLEGFKIDQMVEEKLEKELESFKTDIFFIIYSLFVLVGVGFVAWNIGQLLNKEFGLW